MPPRFGGAPLCQRCDKAVYMAEQVIGPGGPYHRTCLTCMECNKRLDSTSLTERDNQAYCRVCYNRKWGPKGYGFASGASFLSTESKTPKEIMEEQQQQDQTMMGQSQQLPPQRTPTPPSSSSPQLPPRPTNKPESPSSSSSLSSSTPGVPLSSFWSSRPTPPPPPSSSTTPATRDIGPSPAVPTSTKPATPPRPAVASKPAYLNTSYVPKKVNIAVQNDTCTKCGKAVYAAELALGAGNKYHKLCLKCIECGKLLSSTNMVDKDFDLYCRSCYTKLHGPKGWKPFIS
ncbi:hypothetical protein O0I10_011122 [Lichtheimia ornata]|uniref:LIM zinc-binding domain-containing protein n=1 Tax=Lichtheimia ornata TaxID=688661 RepID=A0AAD7UTG0_9FUNG|nr:uncharacterized protein O0I10_011122 [Lichtheimia ornata]KAJ8653274.1 hypothetical protein O0I10_011122 [Lichtheimia ornata]